LIKVLRDYALEGATTYFHHPTQIVASNKRLKK